MTSATASFLKCRSRKYMTMRGQNTSRIINGSWSKTIHGSRYRKYECTVRSSAHATRQRNEWHARRETADAHRRLSGALALYWRRWLSTSAFHGRGIGSDRRDGTRCRRLHPIRDRKSVGLGKI